MKDREDPSLKVQKSNVTAKKHAEIHVTLESAALLSTPHGPRRDTDTACRQRYKKMKVRRRTDVK